MKKKCPQCKLVNYPTADACVRCGSALLRLADQDEPLRPPPRIFRRLLVLLLVCIAAVAGFYVSLLFSADRPGVQEKATINAAIDIIESRGFAQEAFILRHVASFRRTDNWLNASVAKENAFAATNFPFEIVTVYPDFYSYPFDDVERAAILLHEAKHLQGADEKEAYEFVWRNREQLGWTLEKYATSTVWSEIRKQTRDYVPVMFVCENNFFSDCTEKVSHGGY